MWKVRISSPAQAKAEEIIEIKTLIAHPMDSGFRRDNVGKAIPRNILTEFVCRYNGREVLRAEFFPAIAANPYLSFFVRADESGELEFEWTDEHGEVARETATITVVT